MEPVNNKLKVLMLLPDFPDDLQNIRGGVHAAVLNLLEGFNVVESLELHLLVFTRNKSKQITISYASHITIHRIWEGPFSYHLLNHATYSLWKLKEIVKLLKPHLIHYQVGNGFLLTSLAIPTSIPKIQTIHGMPLHEARIKNKLTDKFKGRFHYLMNRLMRPINTIHLSYFSHQLNHNRPNHQSVIIPNALKINYTDLPINESFKQQLLFIGQLDRNKNLLFVFALLKSLNLKNYRYQLQVAGGITNKPYYEEIQKQILELGIQDQVIFNGWCDELKKKELMQNADILLVPSFHESYPMVILEGMSAGLIVLANQTGGIPEIITHGVNGFLFEVQQLESCVRIIEYLEDNRSMIPFIRKQAKEFAHKKYHPNQIANDTFSFYQKVLNNDSL